jgi:hypothetical protein
VGQRDPRHDLKQDVLREVVDGEEVVSFRAQVREVGLDFCQSSLDPQSGGYDVV